MHSYLTTLYEIVTRGLNTNSYKFALWRALARLASDTDPKRPVISKDTLATLFLEYYWDLEISYHLRQGTDPDKDPAKNSEILKAGCEGNTASSSILWRARHLTMLFPVFTLFTVLLFRQAYSPFQGK